MYWHERIRQQLVEQGLEQKYNYPGIYAISINKKIVYVGKAKNMLSRIAEHITEIQKSNPKSHKYQVIREAKLKGYEIQFDVLYRSPKVREDAIINDIGYKEGVYIRKLAPALNYQIPKTEDWRRFKVNACAKTITLDQILNKEV